MKLLRKNTLIAVFPDIVNVYKAISAEFDIEQRKKSYVGIDPGTTHLGIAVTYHKIVDLYEIELLQRKNSIQIISSVWQLMSWLSPSYDIASITIEGASYNATHGQVQLETVRSAFVGWAIMRNIDANVVPPKTVRKVAFGNGNTKNPWKGEIPDNAAAALGCALYGVRK